MLLLRPGEISVCHARGHRNTFCIDELYFALLPPGWSAFYHNCTPLFSRRFPSRLRNFLADLAGAPLESRTITAAKYDWVGIGVGRMRRLKDANNVARNPYANLAEKNPEKIFGMEHNEAMCSTPATQSMRTSRIGRATRTQTRNLTSSWRASSRTSTKCCPWKAAGDISIRYSSPEGLPFSFEWAATIKPDFGIICADET